MRLIDADALMEHSTIRDRVIGAEYVVTAPTIDAVPVTRCRDCQYCWLYNDGHAKCRIHGMCVTADYFCASGKKEEALEKVESVSSEQSVGKTKQASKLLLSIENEHLEVRSAGADVRVRYADCQVEDGGYWNAKSGRGRNFEEACEDYLAKIRGKTLVFRNGTSRRKEAAVLG